MVTEGDHRVSTKPLLSNRAYDILKQIVTVSLPGVGALYFGLAQIWGLPLSEEIVGSITVVSTFLGLLLKVSTRRYNDSEDRYDGNLNVVRLEEDGVPEFILALNNQHAVEEIPNKREVTFKVRSS